MVVYNNSQTLIGNADTSIDVALYGLNRQSIVNALIAAHNRGVTVHVVGDDDAAAGECSGSYQALANAGIPVVIDTRCVRLPCYQFCDPVSVDYPLARLPRSPAGGRTWLKLATLQIV